MAVAYALIQQRRAQRQQELARLSTGLYTSSADPEITQKLLRSRQLSRERAAQNAMLKAIRLGKFGQRSLLSGSFAGITSEEAARASLGGTMPGASVGAAQGGVSSSGASGARGSVGSGVSRATSRSLMR